MRGYAVTNIFSERERETLRAATAMVEAAPDLPEIRCHELARAIGTILGLEVVDGKYGHVDHSWLIIPCEPRRPEPRILDVYSVGSLPQVRILDDFWGLPHKDNFKKGPIRDDVDEELVEELVQAMRQAGTVAPCESSGKGPMTTPPTTTSSSGRTSS